MRTVHCKYCGGDRPVCNETCRCKGCGMKAHECTQTPEPPGKRPCPVCECGMTHWIMGFTKLKCIVCANIFDPLTREEPCSV